MSRVNWRSSRESPNSQNFLAIKASEFGSDRATHRSVYSIACHIIQESLAIENMTARCALYKLFTLILFTLTAIYFARILILNEYKLQKFCLFLQEWLFGRSRSSEVIDYGANQKRVCDFLLVRNSNLGPVLHYSGDMTAFMCSWPQLYSTVILGCTRCTRSPMLGSASACLKLFGREIIPNPTYVSTVPVGLPEVRHRQTDRQTDRQTLYWVNTALCVSREKKKSLCHEWHIACNYVLCFMF